MTAPKLTQTAPERIWLQVNTEDRDDCHQQFPYGSEVTWCSESIGGAEVAYFRKDLMDAEIERHKREYRRLDLTFTYVLALVVSVNTVWIFAVLKSAGYL